MSQINKLVNPLVIVLIVFWIAFTPGPKTAHDLPYIYPSTFEDRTIIPQTWKTLGSDSMGYFSIDTLWSWPLDTLVVFLSRLGFSFSTIMLGLFVLPSIFFGYFGMKNLLESLEISKMGVTCGSLFFLLNSYFILLIDGGQLSLALAYAILPWCFYNWRLARGFVRGRVVFITSIILLSIIDPRFIILLGILIFFDSVYYLIGAEYKRNGLRLILKLGSLTFLFLVGIHLYWLWPLLHARQSGLPSSYTEVSQLSFLNFTTMGHALLFLQPHWYQNIFGKINGLRWGFVGIPVLVFLSPIIYRKNKELAFWLFISVVMLFLVKGAQPPLSEIYTWLFTYLPGFKLFRDSTKFFSLLAVSYSVLIAYTTGFISKKYKNFAFVICTYFIVLISPVFTGKMSGFFSIPHGVDIYRRIAEFLSSDEEFGRVLWIPKQASLGFSDVYHSAIEAGVLLEKRPFLINNVGRYESHNYLRESPYMNQLLDISSIKYLIYPPPESTKDLGYHSTFLGQLSAKEWVGKKISFADIPVLQTKKHQGNFFMVSNLWAVMGEDDPIYRSGVNLLHNGLVFVEERRGLLKELLKFPEVKVVLNNKTDTDVVLNLIPDDSFFTAPLSGSLWKKSPTDFFSWRSFLQNKYGLDNLDFAFGGDWTVSEGGGEFSFTHQLGGTLFARVLFSNVGGKMTFLQGDKSIGEFSTLSTDVGKKVIRLSGYKDIPDKSSTYSKAEFHWVEIGQLKNGEAVKVTTKGPLNVINLFAVVKQSEVSSAKERLALLSSQGRIVEAIPMSLDSEVKSVEYVRKSSSTYELRVPHLDKPHFLVFSQNYNDLWRLNNQAPIPVFSFINGFYLESGGAYQLEFYPQRYVRGGLFISIIVAIVITGLLVSKFYKPYKH